MTVPAHPRSEPEETGPRGLLDRAGIPRALAWGFLGVLIFMIGDGVESGFLSPYLLDQGLSKDRVALLFTVYGVTASVSAWFSGALSDLWGPRRVMLLGLGVWTTLQMVFLGLAVPTHHYALLVISYGLRGFGYPLFAYGFLVWVTAVTPRHRLGSAVGWFWFAFTGGLPTLGSLAASFTVPWLGAYRTLWFSLVLVVAGGLVALFLVREPRGRNRLAPPGADLEHNTRDGLHIASLAGTWIALVAGFGGMRRYQGEEGHPGRLAFVPRLPETLSRIAFTVLVRGRRLRVDVGRTNVRYALAEGEPLVVLHHGEPVTLTAGTPVDRPMPPAPARPEPQQPPGRRPIGLPTGEGAWPGPPEQGPPS